MQIKVNDNLIPILDYREGANGDIFHYSVTLANEDFVDSLKELSTIEIINGETTISTEGVSLEHYSVYSGNTTVVYVKKAANPSVYTQIDAIRSEMSIQENGMCELDVAYSGRIKDLENALCELSEMLGGNE